jgi:hypothetical protein
MPLTPAEFWGVNYYKHPPFTREMVEYAENFLEVKLPALLVELLQFQNGGYTKDFGFPMTQETSWADDHVPMEELFGIVIDQSLETAQNMIDRDLLEEHAPYLPKKQVLLAGDGHCWITLDYRFGEVPSVLWIDTEVEEIIPIAPTFESFYDGLRPISVFNLDQ